MFEAFNKVMASFCGDRLQRSFCLNFHLSPIINATSNGLLTSAWYRVWVVYINLFKSFYSRLCTRKDFPRTLPLSIISDLESWNLVFIEIRIILFSIRAGDAIRSSCTECHSVLFSSYSSENTYSMYTIRASTSFSTLLQKNYEVIIVQKC